MSRPIPPKAERLKRGQTPTWERLQAAHAQQGQPPAEDLTEVILDCGWGRLLVGHTFQEPQRLAEALLDETPGERDIALYVADPHVVLSYAPQQLFLDPSDTLRLWLSNYRPAQNGMRGFHIRRPQCEADWQGINTLYLSNGMVQVNPERLTPREAGGPDFWLAEDADTGDIIGTVMGLNHARAYGDPDKGSSLWCLAADSQTQRFGVGEMLVRHLIEYFMSRGSAYMDLSVLHDNAQAKALYSKLGFRQLRTFTIKRKNSINQPLFLGPDQNEGLNPYARIITRAAQRRGIEVQVNDAEAGLFTLTQGGRSIRCRESLSDLTTAVSMTLCQQKQLTHRCLQRHGLNTPTWQLAGDPEANAAFLAEHGALVVKPDNGEQGNGVAVNIRDPETLEQAIEAARRFDSCVLLESFHEGDDLRIVVINFQVVAAAIRKPAEIRGDGCKTVRELIEKQSRRRQASTGGESRIPLDEETIRTVEAAGFTLDSILPADQHLQVRRTANLHTGGTLVDVTDALHPALRGCAIAAARALDIPVVGMDLLVPAVDQPDYVIIEANERPGLANHEPQPTAECFIDLLFPLSQPG
ncbi:glutathione synthase [Pseudomonas saudimassiliensis]|uniref:Glutathione synthase n=1 Tax=Pseudomonas saudimassiliensis TaxID=1461581 RepID=A0A078MHV6_9PSED|nr:N-acetylglutaminylglutamine synthetase [Pseudomonas saudimassiliensis]CEA04251.1 glutathione synthase [Pseudomonas saudimassiliensis]CEF26494.1 glutathione synthase [Pseudomonas saudimassiliensis]